MILRISIASLLSFILGIPLFATARPAPGFGARDAETQDNRAADFG